jgi:hypothetical protein
MTGKPLGGIKIIGPKPKGPASTHLSGTQKGILILRSKRYLHHKYFFYRSFLICRLLDRVPQGILRPLLWGTFNLRMSPRRWTSPRVLLLKKPFQGRQIPQAQWTLAPRVLRLPRPLVTQDMILPSSLQGQILPRTKMHSRLAQSHLDSWLMVDHNLVKPHPGQGLGNNHDNIRVLQSPCGTTQTSFRLGSTLVNTYRQP